MVLALTPLAGIMNLADIGENLELQRLWYELSFMSPEMLLSRPRCGATSLRDLRRALLIDLQEICLCTARTSRIYYTRVQDLLASQS